jgi:hypothetical protein
LLKVQINPVEKDVEAMLRADLSRAEQQKVAAEYARVGIEEAKEINRRILGRVPPYTVTVDGSRGARLESVNPNGGAIIVEFELIEGLLRWIADELVKRSPVVSGDYRRGHTLFADGKEVAIGDTIPAAEEYTFTNTVPYARKIEVGHTKSGRAFVLQVPNRIYERTAKDARGRFGNTADIKFAFRDVAGAYTLRHSSGRRKGRQRGNAVSSPAIIIRSRKI